MTRLIGPANPFIRTDVDVAFDADLSAPAESWDWTTLGDYTDGPHTRPRVLDQTVEVFHGRRDESALADPSTIEVELGNGDGALTPRNPASPYYPGLKRGTPVRVTVTAGSSYLSLTGLPGSRASTPDAASWNIGANLAVAVQFRAPVRLPPFGLAYEVMGQFTVTGGQRSWLSFIANSGAPSLRFSTDGTNETDAEAGLAVPSPSAGPLTVAWVLDGDNGAGGNTTTFYVCRGTIAELLSDPAAFTFGDPDVNSGTITLHNSTGTVGVGDVPGSGFSPYPGAIDAWYVRAGTLTSGTVVADTRNLSSQADGTASFADQAATPKTWTIASAEITNRHPRFTGRVDKVTAGWEQVDEANPLMPTIATAKVSASSLLEGLAQSTEALQSALYRRITAPLTDTTVRAYWPLEDGRDATTLFTVGGTPGGTMAVPLASDDTLASSSPLPSVSGGQPFGWNLALPPVTSVSAWEFTMLVKIPVAPVAGSGEFLDLCRIDCIGGVTSQWVLRIDDTNYRVFAKDLDGANVLSASGASDPRMFGVWLIVTLTIGLSGANITWDIDLTPVGGGSFSSNGTLASLGLPAGRPVRLRNLDAAAAQEGASFGHFIVTEGAVTGWLAPADTAYVGEPAPARVFRLCREQGIPMSVDGPHMVGSTTGWPRAIAAGAQPMGPQRPDRLLALLEECAVVDHAVLGEAGWGLAYRSGVSMLNQTPRLRLERARRHVVDPFELVDDDQRFVNDVTATRPRGSSYRVADPAIDGGTVERYERSVETNVADDGWLPHQAGWRYHLGTWEEPRFPQAWSDVAKDTDLVDDVLGFGVGDRFTIPDPPPTCPPVDQLADGIVEELERFQWRVGVNGHPARPWDVGVLDDDTPTVELARVPTDGSTLAGSLSDTATGGVSVNVTGALWTTDAAYFPLDIEITGEVVTLSGISGANSPQTFTISARSVNGVVKSHAAGEAVEVAVPFRLSM